MNMHDLEMAERFFARFGSAAVFICRLLPLVRSFIAFPAGVARMPQIRFHIYTFLGSWPWCFALAWIGMKLGERWHSDPRVGRVLHSLDAVIVVVILGRGRLLYLAPAPWPQARATLIGAAMQPTWRLC